MVVKYIAYTWQGEKVEGVLDVDQLDEARELLQRDELIPYRLTMVKPRRSLAQLAPFLFKPKPKEMIELTQGVASLLRSGIPLRESLISLRDQNISLGLKEVVRQVVQDIEGGDRFSEALARHPSMFSTFSIRIIEFGETTGGMAPAMMQLAETMEKSKAMKDKVKSALIYPMISLVVAIAVAGILVTFSLPALTGLLEDFGGELPTITKLLVAIADFIGLYKMQMFGVIFGVGISLWLYLRTKSGAIRRDRVLLKLPVISRVLVQSSLFHFASIFSTLLQSGIPTVEALQLSRDSLDNVVLRERMDRVIYEVNQGNRMGVAFQQHWPDPPLLSQAIITGEASGNVAPALQGLAEYYETESMRAISGATELIQPAVILLVAGLVGFVAVAVMSGIYSGLNSIE